MPVEVNSRCHAKRGSLDHLDGYRCVSQAAGKTTKVLMPLTQKKDPEFLEY